MWGDSPHGYLSSLPPPSSREGTLRAPLGLGHLQQLLETHRPLALRAVLGVVYLSAQAKHLTALVGTPCVAHLQGHGGIITFACPQLCVINVPPGPWSHHAHLAGTLVCAHLEADGRVVHGGQDAVLGVVQMPSGVMPGWLAHLLVPIWSPMTHWPAFMVASSKFRSCLSEYLKPMSTPLCRPSVLTFPARARRDACTRVKFPLSNRSLASNRWTGFMP